MTEQGAAQREAEPTMQARQQDVQAFQERLQRWEQRQTARRFTKRRKHN